MSGFIGLSKKQISESEVSAIIAAISKTSKNPTRHWIDKSRSHCIIIHGDDTNFYHDNNLLAVVLGRPDLNFDTPSDKIAEKIASVYRQKGESFLKHLSGPFTLALVDIEKEKTVFAIDRMGVGTMCYSKTPEFTIFSNRADFIPYYPEFNAQLDEQSIYNYFYFHCIPSPRTIYRNIDKLAPGQSITHTPVSTKKNYYWELDYNKSDSSFPELKKQLVYFLENAVIKNIGNGKTGAFLSGGTDSSTVCGFFAKNSSEKVPTYSIGFAAEGYDEIAYSRIASSHFDTSPHEYYITHNDVLNAIPLIASAFDEPFGNASSIAAYYCAKLAKRDGIATLLAGDGGDEIFGGNERYARQMIFEQYQKVPQILRNTILEPLLNKHLKNLNIKTLNKIRSYIQQANIPLPDRIESYNFLNRFAINDIFEDGFLENINPEEPIKNMREVYERTKSKNHVDKMMHMDLKVTLADNDLRKVGKMCQLAGINVRYPMLDENLVCFSATIPANLQIRNFKLRYFFKKALRDFLPAEIITKKKHGFGLPFGIWLQESPKLLEFARTNTEKFSQRGFVKKRYIDQVWELQKNSDRAYYGVMIWNIMMLEQWLQKHGY